MGLLLVFSPRAAYAVVTLEDIQTSVNNVGTQTGSVLTNTNTIKSQATSILSGVGSLEDAVDGVQDIVQIVHDNYNLLSPQFFTLINQGLDQAQVMAQEELAGLDDFLGGDGMCSSSSPCYVFRENLQNLLTQMEDVTNAVLDANPTDLPFPLHISFNLARQELDELPGAALYPAYRILVVGMNLFNSGFPAQVAALPAYIHQWADQLAADRLLDQTYPADYTVAGLASCENNIANRQEAVAASYALSGSGLIFKIIGKALDIKGETHLKAKAGVHGYPGIIFENNRARKWGGRFGGISEALLSMGTYFTEKTRHCETIENQAAIISNQEAIMNSLGLVPHVNPHSVH